MSGRNRFRAVVLAVLLVVAAPVQAKDLLDFVIEAVDPTLAPARPLIECLAGGGSAEYCAVEAAKKQTAGVLPIGPGDDRIKLAVGVFTAARDERWFDVLNIGGEVVAKSVACAMLPVQGPLKGTACGIVGWVIANNAGVLDKAYQALKGPDWWALVDLLGPAACDLIPGDGAAGYAKEVICGPLAAVLLEVKKWAEAVGNSVVAGADALENLVFGDDSHMSYDRYFALYWQPWYHYSTARIWRNEGLGPAVNSVYNRCVDYFDSHNQYRSTAKKTCGDLKKKFDKHVQGFAAALPVAVDGYFETIAKPAIRGFARAGFGKPTPDERPGENLFVMNCAFQIRQRFPFPEPDELRCELLVDKSKEYANVGIVPLGPLFQAQAKTCFSHVQQQTLDPTVWQMACDELRARYRQVYTGETLKLMQAIGEAKKAGCLLTDPDEIGKLRLVCETYAAQSACLEALAPNAGKYCHLPPLKMSDAKDHPQSAAGVVLVPPAASTGKATRGAPGPAVRDAAPAVRDAGPAVRDAGPAVRDAGPAVRNIGPAVRDLGPAVAAVAGRVRSHTLAVEAEVLLTDRKIRLGGGQAVVQPMAGFGPGWSGDAQVFWHGGAVGATLDLMVDVPRDGAWVVEIALTQAPDYGELAFEVDGHPVAQRFDGYAPQVAGPVTVVLGTFAMQQGSRPVSLKIVGRNRTATGWLVGVDRIVLQPAGG
jgi:hypothetical protein